MYGAPNRSLVQGGNPTTKQSPLDSSSSLRLDSFSFRGLPGWRRAWQCALLLRFEPLLFDAFHHPDALRRAQILLHRDAQLTDGLAHFAADLLVNLAGRSEEHT